jgi:hypothetical protein
VILGAVAVVVSIFLRWFDLNISTTFHVSLHYTATGVPVQFLWDYTTKSNDPSLLVVLIPSAVLALVGVALIRARWLTFVGGALAIAVAAAYSFQLHQGLNTVRRSLHGAIKIGLSDLLGIAPIICFVGGILIVVGALVPRGRRSSAA